MASSASRLKSMLRALTHRNFRLFFMGQTVSLIGTWMQQIAMAWLVYRLTNSPFLLGVVGFAGQIPSFFLAPLAGVLTDRCNRHRLLLLTQTAAMLQAFLLAFLTLTGQITVDQVIVLSVLLGFVNAFDMTARQAFLTEMVTRKEDVANAIALNSSMVNGARLFGPSLAGLVIAATGEGICFLLNGLSFLAVLAALLLMNVPPRERAVAHKPLVAGLKEGAAYAFGFAPIRSILLLLAVVSFLGMPYTVLMPVIATEVFHGGADVLGFLMGASGVGALLGAVYLASRQSILGLGIRIAVAPMVFGAALVAFSFCHVLWLALVLLFVAGFATMVQMASSNTILQTIVEEDKRGRVMSFYAMAFMGTMPFGSLLAGTLADYLGATRTIMLGGLCCIGAAVFFARELPVIRGLVRPIYIRMGILPEVAAGIQTASELSVPPGD